MSFSWTSRPIFTIETISSAISLVKISVHVPRTSNTGQEIIPNARLGNLSLSLLIRGGMIAAHRQTRCGYPCIRLRVVAAVGRPNSVDWEPLRARLELGWWPGVGLLVLAGAGVVVVAVILAGGRSSETPLQGARAPARPATAAPASASNGPADACAPSAAGPSGEATLFDKLSKGATRDNPDFDVSFTAGVSDHGARAHADLSLEMHVPGGDVAPKAFSVLLPKEWNITPGCAIPLGLAIGSLRWDVLLGRQGNPCNEPAPLIFRMVNSSTNTSDTVDFRDADGNGTPDFAEDKDHTGRPDVIEKYPAFLNRMFPGRQPLRRTAGLFTYVNPPVLAQSLAFKDLDGTAGTTLVFLLQDLGDPEAVAGKSGFSDYCTPFEFRMTDSGATYSGAPLYTNPPAGRYQIILTAFGERDADGDGIENGLDTCPFDKNVGNPRVKGDGDADQDGLDAACDPNDFEANPDQDSDGYLNRDDICPLVKADDSSTQKDTDGDQIGDECDTSGKGPNVPDGDVPLAIQAAEVNIH